MSGNARNSVCLFIGTLKAGGAERVMSWLANRLANDGYDVTLVTLGGLDEDFFTLTPSVRRIALDLQGKNHPIMKPFANIRRIIALRSVILSTGAERLVAFMPHESILAITAVIGTRCRVTVSERTAPWRRDLGFLWTILRWLLYRFADGHAAQTRATAEWLRKQTRAKNVNVIPNPVQLPVPSVQPRVLPQDYLRGRPCVLAVGGRPFLKGLDLLVHAFAQLAGKHPEWDLAILGLDSSEKDNSTASRDLYSTLAQPVVKGRVHLPGRVGNPSEWYNSAEIFVLSSRVEGFPNALIEAMSHGCAVAAFDCETGPRDIITHNQDGLLVPDNDVDALTKELERLMSDPDLRRRLSKTAPRVTKQYSEDRVAALWKYALR